MAGYGWELITFMRPFAHQHSIHSLQGNACRQRKSIAPQRSEIMRLQAVAISFRYMTVAQSLIKQEHKFNSECYVVSDTMQVAKY